MPKSILSVSYYDELLITRRMLLEREGHKVTSALGFTDSAELCRRSSFDLFILGHSIPEADKQELIRIFRKANSAPVLSLQRHGESPVTAADYQAPVDDPVEFLKTVAAILGNNPK